MRDFLRDIWSRTRRHDEPPAERPTYEQMREQIELAERFDKLQGLPVWESIVKRMGGNVNGELAEAAKFRYEPVRQTAHVVRWDAKRELLDDLLGWMDGVQSERDRIIDEFRGISDARSTDPSAGN